ncbi:MAG: toll/interleukin-1 receptor domain-containing protein [Hyphomonadaceae bacterium]|nr:toll/interleukin-1 receptor domain-containing protein [Hyphomonadaceae bacterium]
MARVFINFDNEDLPIAEALADALRSEGLDAPFEEYLTFANEALDATLAERIESDLQTADCVLTIWSSHSVRSEWVLAEAEVGAKRGVLVQVCVGEAAPPSDFGQSPSVRIDAAKADLAPAVAAARLMALGLVARRDVPIMKTLQVRKPLAAAAEPLAKRAFISYASRNEDLAIQLVEALEKAGCGCWISFRDVDPGADYRASIAHAIEACSFLVLVYSDHANTSFDIATELLLARKRGKGRFVLKTDGSAPAGPVEYELATVQWIDCQGDFAAGADKMAQRARLLP